jgi:hypothetical protein
MLDSKILEIESPTILYQHGYALFLKLMPRRVYSLAKKSSPKPYATD